MHHYAQEIVVDKLDVASESSPHKPRIIGLGDPAEVATLKSKVASLLELAPVLTSRSKLKLLSKEQQPSAQVETSTQAALSPVHTLQHVHGACPKLTTVGSKLHPIGSPKPINPLASPCKQGTTPIKPQDKANQHAATTPLRGIEQHIQQNSNPSTDDQIKQEGPKVVRTSIGKAGAPKLLVKGDAKVKDNIMHNQLTVLQQLPNTKTSASNKGIQAIISSQRKRQRHARKTTDTSSEESADAQSDYSAGEVIIIHNSTPPTKKQIVRSSQPTAGTTRSGKVRKPADRSDHKQRMEMDQASQRQHI